MTDYPDDILRAAEDIALTYAADICIADLEKAIAAALAAERERAAKICDDKGFFEFGDEIRGEKP